MDEKFSISFKNNPWEIYRVVEFLKFTIAVKISFAPIDWLIFVSPSETNKNKMKYIRE